MMRVVGHKMGGSATSPPLHRLDCTFLWFKATKFAPARTGEDRGSLSLALKAGSCTLASTASTPDKLAAIVEHLGKSNSQLPQSVHIQPFVQVLLHQISQMVHITWVSQCDNMWSYMHLIEHIKGEGRAVVQYLAWLLMCIGIHI